MAGVAEHVDEAAGRLGVTLRMPALELIRLSTGIAHGLALEQLMNREKVDARIIELAFTPIDELSVRDDTAARRGARSDGRIKQRRSDGGARRRRGR